MSDFGGDYSDEVAALPWPDPISGEQVHRAECPKCQGVTSIAFPHLEIPEDTYAAGALGRCPCGGVFQLAAGEAERILGRPDEIHAGSHLGRAAGAGAGEPARGDDAYETVFGLYTDDPTNAMCIVCGDDLNLNELPDPNRLLCPECRGRADHHDKEN